MNENETSGFPPPFGHEHWGLRARLELWSALLLAAATVATAYSAYESTRWGGVQATKFTEASAARTESTKASADAYSLIAIDAELFTQYAVALFGREVELLEFIEERLFRREFRPAFREWIQQRPLTNPDAAQNPFTLDSYEPALLEKSDRLEEKASALFEEGRQANQNSDDYVLSTIFFASVLFFAGLATKFTKNRVAQGTLVFGTLVFLAGLARLFTLPFH